MVYLNFTSFLWFISALICDQLVALGLEILLYLKGTKWRASPLLEDTVAEIYVRDAIEDTMVSEGESMGLLFAVPTIYQSKHPAIVRLLGQIVFGFTPHLLSWPRLLALEVESRPSVELMSVLCHSREHQVGIRDSKLSLDHPLHPLNLIRPPAPGSSHHQCVKGLWNLRQRQTIMRAWKCWFCFSRLRRSYVFHTCCRLEQKGTHRPEKGRQNVEPDLAD